MKLPCVNLVCTITLTAASLLACNRADAREDGYDVVVYGGTSSGVVAAVQTARMGKTVVLIEPGKHLGGLTSGGLGFTDSGRKSAIGGISREFYQRIKKHYDRPAAWQQEKQKDYSRYRPGEDAMWTFEPHVAEAVYEAMIAEARVPVVKQERLDLKKGVSVVAGRISEIRMESGKAFRGKMFIDATYEGDLMAKAGVTYTVGREANARYGETLNGVQKGHAYHHQLRPGVDPYVKPGDPSSGLLPGVWASDGKKDGEGDHRVQAYCYRMCNTDDPDNRVPFAKPKGYNELRYELLFRNFEAGETRIPWKPDRMPNRKTDTNNNYGFSMDNIGMNYDYPDGDYATREKILEEHRIYQQGLMWTLANHPRVPEKIRKEMSRWGLARDEFVDNNHWPHQLYIREARRMVSDYVTTEHDCRRTRVAADSVGLGSYNMDSHNCQRYVTPEGFARNEGDVQVSPRGAYVVSYRSLVPKRSEVQNLLVPVCLSASHIAYGSIRMEPVFMVLGQSAATAAVQAIDANVAVQDVEYAKLRARLLADKQVLDLSESDLASPGIDPAKLPGIVIDDTKAVVRGSWAMSHSVSPYVGAGYLHDQNEGKGSRSAKYEAKLKPGRYEVRMSYSANPNRATNLVVEVQHAGGTAKVKVNQRQAPAIDKLWHSLGTYAFTADAPGSVLINNEGTDGFVIVDAVQFLKVLPR